MSAKQWHRKRKRERLEKELGPLLTYLDADYEPVYEPVPTIAFPWLKYELPRIWKRIKSAIRNLFYRRR